MTYEDIPGGCYTPDHWKIANGIGLQPESNSTHEATTQGRIKPYLTEETLDEYLAANGITVRLNVITHEVDVGGVGGCYNPESTRNDLPVILYDELKQRFRCDKQTLCDLPNLIAGRNRYNPVFELIDLCEWDGEDYLGQLVEILGIREDDTLSQTLLYKWAVQCYQLLHNQIGLNVSADGMLVLQGPQGCGKTSFVRQIGIRPDFVKLGQWIDPKDKDRLYSESGGTRPGGCFNRQRLHRLRSGPDAPGHPTQGLFPVRPGPAGYEDDGDQRPRGGHVDGAGLGAAVLPDLEGRWQQEGP